jgi:hypothetical protein
MLKKLGETALRGGMKLMSDPRVMRMMSDPRVMKVVMQALQLRGTIQGAVDHTTRELARRFGLVTESEVAELRARLRDLESKVETVESRVDDAGGYDAEGEVAAS